VYRVGINKGIIRTVLWYFFHAEIIIEGYMNSYKSSWRWKLGCSKHVEDTV